MTTSYQFTVNNYQLTMHYQFAVIYEASLLTVNSQPTVNSPQLMAFCNLSTVTCNLSAKGGHHG